MADEWPPQALALAQELRAKGLPASRISMALMQAGYGYSRLAVVGKLYRAKADKGAARRGSGSPGQIASDIAEPSPPRRFSWEREA